MGLFWTNQRALVSSTEQTSTQHSVTCDVSLRMDLTNCRFKLRLQCTHCICVIVYIVLCWEWGNYWTIAGTLCVCVCWSFSVWLCMWYVCLCVCMCERDCILCGVWLWFWTKTMSLRFYHQSSWTISFLSISNHQSILAWNSPGEWIKLSEVCWGQDHLHILGLHSSLTLHITLYADILQTHQKLT